MTIPHNDEKGLVSGVAPSERRRRARMKIAPSEIIYMHFQSGNGGVVLDVSSTGVGFQTADPVLAEETVSIRLSPPAIQHIEISGQVMWLDGTRKRGGLRLYDLPIEVLKEFQLWGHRDLSPAPAVQRPAEAKADPFPRTTNFTNSSATRTIAPAARGTHSTSFSTVQHTSESPVPVQQNLPSRTQFAPAPGYGPNAPESSPWDPPAGLRAHLYPTEPKRPVLSSPKEWRRGGGVVTFFLIVALLAVVAVGFFYFGNRRWAGELLIRLGESISSEQSKASVETPSGERARAGAEAPTMPAPPDSEVALPGDSHGALQTPDTSDVNTDASALGRETTNLPDQADANRTVPESTGRGGEAPAGGDTGQAELARARRYLRATGGEGSAVAEQLLWLSVEKGNTRAELELADLYLRGNGTVPKNCQQARILLVAAQNNHNAEAGERLAHLEDYGCR
jgi:hypothetical protein